ncbi:MAG: serine/threonine protein kinase [Spirochaetaceae bacterium]
MEHRGGDFDLLSPHVALDAVEAAFGSVLDGTVQQYPSYINRVYGVRDDEGRGFVAKFYRPDRWSEEALREEHQFIADCAAHEIPVVEAITAPDGDTLQIVEVEGTDRRVDYRFALFPKRGGRNFDAEGDEEWYRLGSIVGRCHRAGAQRSAEHRQVCDPDAWTLPLLEELLESGVVHPDSRGELGDVVTTVIRTIRPLFQGVGMQRIHGDCHRGNLLERPDEGLVIIDFDDMMVGPAVQDLWLLLPGYAVDSGRELTMLLDGYETFAELDRRELELIEPLRFMRMVHFLGWQARQRRDRDFETRFPWWGTKEFWIREVEDLRTQAAVVMGGAR